MSWSEFASMGGYGFFVWGAYGVTFALLAIEVAVLTSRSRMADRTARQENRNKATNENQV